MRTGKVLLLVLGVTACMCWMISSAIAEDQPAHRMSVGQAGMETQASQAPSAAQPKDAGTARNQVVHLPGGGIAVVDNNAMPMSARVVEGDFSDAPPLPPGTPRANQCQDGTSWGYGTWPTATDCGNRVFCSELPGGQVFFGGAASANEILLDDIETAGTDHEICEVTAIPYAHTANLVPYQITLTIWTDCPPSAGGSGVVLATQTQTMTTRYGTLVFTFDPPILVPDNAPAPPTGAAIDFWLGLQHNKPSGSQIGVLIRGCNATTPYEKVELGWSNDMFGDETQCNWYFGGCTANPPGTWLWKILAKSRTGACCHRNTGVCDYPATIATCSGPYDVFNPDKTCAQITCTPALGACCDLSVPPGTCSNHVNIATCLGPNGNNGNKFQEGVDCVPDPFSPDCGKGACCVLQDSVYTCLENGGAGYTQAECQALPGFVMWKWNKLCADILGCHPVPANDLCENATTLTGSCVTVTFNTENATFTAASVPDDPPSCLEPPETTTAIPMVNDIWYKYTIPTTYGPTNQAVTAGKVVISTLGSYYDTVMVVYGKIDTTAACGAGGAVACPVSQDVDERACSDDIEGGTIQASYVEIPVGGGSGVMQPGACLLIRVGGLEQTGNPAGGAGQLNLDFYPTAGADPSWSLSSGVCCTSSGCSWLDQTACTNAGGYFRSMTDFFEYGAVYDPTFGGTPPEYTAHYCCAAHGEYGSCQQGEYCAKPIPLGTFNSTWTGNVHKVTYFSFETRAMVGGQPYAITIDTCGSAFDTILTVYKGPESGYAFTDYGECADDMASPPASMVERNDECTTAGAPDVQGKPSVACFGTTVGESCMCLTVGPDESQKQLQAGNRYYIAVGKYESGMTRPMGVDPEPNYPKNPAKALSLKIAQQGITSCEPCMTNCCKGDLTGDGKVDGRDIAGFVSALVSTPKPACDTAAWCAANMNGDYLLDINDVPLFVAALIYGYGCTPITMDCTNDTTYHCQLPDQSGHGCGSYFASGSDVPWGILGQDNFCSRTGGLVTSVCWWGFYIGSSAPCGPLAPSFQITYYNDNNNQPGTVKAGPFTVTPTQTLTGLSVGSFPEYKFTATHSTVIVAPDEQVWIEIANLTSGGGSCYFYWEITEPGDGMSWQAYEVNDFDLAFCVNIPIYSNGCGNISCDITCSGTTYETERADCTEPPEFANTNLGCSALTPAGQVFTQINMTNNQTVTICGHLGTYTGEIACDEAADCTPDACVGGFCNGGPYTLRDLDWYQLNLTGGSAKISLTIETENETSMWFATTTPQSPNPICNSSTVGYGMDIGCASGVCVRDPLGGSNPTIFPVGRHIFFIGGANWAVPCNTEYRITITTTPG